MTTHSTGTISVGVSSTSVTGAGTGWVAGGVRAGDILLAAGNAVPVAAVVSGTSLTLARPWPGGALAGANYDILLIDDNVRTLVAANTLMQQLGNGTLASLAAQASAANKLPYFTGANAMALTDLSAFARTLLDDVTQAAARTTLGLVPVSGATDVTAGRLPTVGWMGLGGLMPVAGNIGVTDNSIAPGLWYHYDSATSSGGPISSGFGFLYHGRRAPGGGEVQIFVAESNGVVFSRARTTGAWTAWARGFSTTNAIGTVSWSSGPTGALIESGSNANGRYVRFADGTQICSQTITSSASIDVEATFPAAFATLTDLRTALSVNSSAGIALSPRHTGRTVTTISVSAFNASNARVATAVEAVTIGRWV